MPASDVTAAGVTPARPRAAVSWSGGKDSLAAVAATRDIHGDHVRRGKCHALDLIPHAAGD